MSGVLGVRKVQDNKLLGPSTPKCQKRGGGTKTTRLWGLAGFVPWPYGLEGRTCAYGSLHLVDVIPIVSIVVPFWGYLIGSLIYNWLNQKRNYNGDYR